MQGHWQLQNSRYAVKVILFLALSLLLLSFFLNITLFAKSGVIFLIPIFIYLLYNNIVLPGSESEYSLSWSEGSWTFCNQSSCKHAINIQGIKNKRSFSLGIMMLLSITDENNRTVELWLFPDSISSQQNNWRKLHCCFFLSAEQSEQFIRKV
ncbi:MAG: hypothetical protein GY808_09300 [Gammaproteobacteria bacterium]|nr:hypothetical protein [Gammaproteobacteria bacterium]